MTGRERASQLPSPLQMPRRRPSTTASTACFGSGVAITTRVGEQGNEIAVYGRCQSCNGAHKVVRYASPVLGGAS